jgi:hypothetical protein
MTRLLHAAWVSEERRPAELKRTWRALRKHFGQEMLIEAVDWSNDIPFTSDLTQNDQLACVSVRERPTASLMSLP